MSWQLNKNVESDELASGQLTYQQNQARSGQLGALQIGGATETPRTGGTQGFKRRKLQINPVTANALVRYTWWYLVPGNKNN